MDFEELIIPAIFIVGIATLIFIGFYFSAKQKILRQLKTVRRKQIHSVRDNEYVKIVGKAKHAGEPLIAPLSKRKCVYFDVKVEEKRGKHWKVIIDDVAFQDFFVSAGTESAIVNLRVQRDHTKRIYLVTDHSLNSGFFKEPDAELKQYLESKGNKPTGFFGMNKTLRYTESIIELDEEIAVMGIGKWKTIDTPVDGYSDSRVLTLTGTPKQRLLITDEPKALKRVDKRL